VLYWIAEKPEKRADGPVWVGRAGENTLYLVWRPSDALTVAQIEANLRAAMGGEDPARTRAIYENVKDVPKKRQEDLENYADAVSRLGSKRSFVDEELPPELPPPRRPRRKTKPPAQPETPVQTTPPEQGGQENKPGLGGSY